MGYLAIIFLMAVLAAYAYKRYSDSWMERHLSELERERFEQEVEAEDAAEEDREDRIWERYRAHMKALKSARENYMPFPHERRLHARGAVWSPYRPPHPMPGKDIKFQIRAERYEPTEQGLKLTEENDL